MYVKWEEHCTQEQREVIKKLLSEGKTFEFIRDLFGVSNGLITNVKNFSPKVETRGKRKKKQVNGRTI